jgi:DNA-binding HxlR family transcriptional regulator
MIKIDEVIHQPIRTRIIAHLINTHECDYSTLKKTLELSDGHMTTHMRVLLKSEYVEMKKEFVKNKPKTTYSITQKGKQKFKEYVEDLKKIIEG